MADFSHLDKQHMQKFVDGDLTEFIGDLKKILEGDPSMRDMDEGVTTEDNVGGVSAGMPIMMGLIDGSDLTSGESFAESLANNITTVVDILQGEQDTFQDIDDGLRTTLEELFKTQESNLSSIKANEFTEILSDSGFSGEAPAGDSGGSSDEDKDEDKDEGSDEDSDSDE